jgi:RsiW-degrading membrane proteinase PrsW (M82 family)
MDKKQLIIFLGIVTLITIGFFLIAYVGFGYMITEKYIPIWISIFFFLITAIALLSLLVITELLAIEKRHSLAFMKKWTESMGRELNLKDSLHTKNNRIKRLKKDINDIRKKV